MKQKAAQVKFSVSIVVVIVSYSLTIENTIPAKKGKLQRCDGKLNRDRIALLTFTSVFADSTVDAILLTKGNRLLLIIHIASYNVRCNRYYVRAALIFLQINLNCLKH